MQLQRLFHKWKLGVVVLLVGFLIVFVSIQPPVAASDPPPSDLNNGPYVDTLVYKVLDNKDQRILELQSGEIEMDTGLIHPEDLPMLEVDPDIDIYEALRNGYGKIVINCKRYPLNISGFRRAFAFAFDKERVTLEIIDGVSQEHDSLVPYANSWCIEDQFEWHYYDDRADIGNQILDDLGFEIDNSTGFRNAPNGEPFDIVFSYGSSSPEIVHSVAQIAVDALHALHIDARKEGSTFNEYISRLDYHEAYDMIFYAVNFYSNDVDWLAFDFWSEYADEPYKNPSNFRNATYDSWREQLLYATTYEEVYEATAEMQKILHYNVPQLVVYTDMYMQGYRNDQFTGHVEDLGRYISGPWTMRKIHKLDGTFGGRVPIAIDSKLSSFNFFVIQSSFSQALHAVVFDNLYSSLYRQGPDLNPWPDLAENMVTETHSDNPAVPDGHTRFTIDIIKNATWSDGVPLTAADVAFTFNYQFESGEYGNPAAVDFAELYAIYTPNLYRVVLEFSTESYWHFGNFAFDYIIPEHIFNDVDGIGYEGWNTWNPVFNSTAPHVTCGPFKFEDYEDGEFYELKYNPIFHYLPGYSPVRPHINPTANIAVFRGTTGHEIVWSTWGTNCGTYSIFMNGTLRESGSWTSGDIRHNIDGLEIGTYVFALTVNDTRGYSTTDTLFVYVRAPGFFQSPLNVLAISISSLSSVVILLTLISIYKNKKTEEHA